MPPTDYTSSELEQLRLPGLPRSARKIRQRAAREGWLTREVGGALRYDVSSLPDIARRALEARAEPEPPPVSLEAPGVSHRHREIAQERMRVVIEIERHIRAGLSVHAAAVAVVGPSTRSAERWWGTVAKLERSQWLAALVPAYRRCATAETRELHPDAWAWLRSHYLRAERPTFASAYKDLCLVAEKTRREWLPIPHATVLLRRLRREVPENVVTALRYGAKAAELRHSPAQRRDRSCFRALQAVCSDGHRADVMVAWPTADGGVRLERPIIVAWQDLYSGMFLGWSIDHTESSDLVRRSFARVVRAWGIPEEVYFDNGRAYASKKITGGVPNRYRFRVREDEEQGVMLALGVRKVGWAIPGRGQSKPIEKAWKDGLVDRMSKDPEFQGAYLGSTPSARPHTYRKDAAVPVARFVEIADAWFRRLNQEPGRRTRVCAGRSFEETFMASYSEGPVARATEEQLRVLLLSSKRMTVRAQGAFLELHGNRYAHPSFAGMGGRDVIVRYDADDLASGTHIYDLDGRYLCRAELLGDVAFRSERDAEVWAKEAARGRKALREAAAEIAPIAGDQLARDLHAAMGVPTRTPTSPKVIALTPRRADPIPTEVAAAMAPTSRELERAERDERLVLAAGAGALSLLTPRRRPSAG